MADIERVCPRCGAPAEAVWCRGCGLNLRLESELPSREAYEAKIREREWVAARDAEARAQQEQRRAEWQANQEAQVQRNREEAERVAKAKERKKALADEEQSPEGASWSRIPRRIGIVAGATLVLAAATAVAFDLVWPEEKSKEPPDQAQDSQTSPERPSTERQRCGRFTDRYRFTVTKEGEVSCADAEDLAQDFVADRDRVEHRGESAATTYYTFPQWPGWKCGTGAGGGGCMNGSIQVTWQSGPAQREPLSGNSPLTTEGLGPVLVGMTLSEAEAAAGTAFMAESAPPNASCRYFRPESLGGVSFMVTNGEIARVDVSEPVVGTLSGIRVGDPIAGVLDEYGKRVTVEPGEFNPDHSLLTYTPSDPSDETRIIFQTDGSHVTGMRSGRLPEVEYVEGCF